MKKTAFLFPGQGSQYAGMGKELAEDFDESKKIFKIGSEIAGFDLLAASCDENELKKTSVAQPCIFAVSLSAFFLARKMGIEAHAAAGHSLGEYAMLAASGMISVEDGFKIIKLRGEAMQKAAEKNPGGMAAVIGMKSNLIENICCEIRKSGDYVLPVNYNSPAQTVIAGTISGLEKAISVLNENKARKIIKLPVNAAFHSELMTDAAVEFKTALQKFTFKKPEIPVYSNVTGMLMTDFSHMPDYLAEHMCSPVKFTDELTAMKQNGINFFIEAGPGKTLTGLIRKTLDAVEVSNIEDSKSLEEVNILCQN